MPPLRHAPTHMQLVAPYSIQPVAPTSRPVQAVPISAIINDVGDKENQPPPAAQATPKAPTVGNNARKQSKNTEPAQVHLPISYLDIPLEEIKGEVPIYENVRCQRFSAPSPASNTLDGRRDPSQT
jgi:hypothetical protein